MRALLFLALGTVLASTACAQEEYKAPELDVKAKQVTLPVQEKLRRIDERDPIAPSPTELQACREALDSATQESIRAGTAPVSALERVKDLSACENVAFGEIKDYGATVQAQRRAPIITCKGIAEQGGAVLCQTAAHSKVKIARSEKDFYFEQADGDGHIIIGFDRDETRNFVEAQGERIVFDIGQKDYDISRIDGLPPSQVSTFSESQLKRIRSSSARKKVGFSSRAKAMGFKNGFDLPIKDEFIKTTNFGAQRILNGEPKRPHYGVDLAAPVGTPIYAPADGIVSLADDDLYFEGAMVLLDHGQGLISMYLHTDEILVEPGQAVKQGEQIATVGSKGRSTGPHLCWRLKWRNRNLDPLLLTEWPTEG